MIVELPGSQPSNYAQRPLTLTVTSRVSYPLLDSKQFDQRRHERGHPLGRCFDFCVERSAPINSINGDPVIQTMDAKAHATFWPQPADQEITHIIAPAAATTIPWPMIVHTRR